MRKLWKRLAQIARNIREVLPSRKIASDEPIEVKYPPKEIAYGYTEAPRPIDWKDPKAKVVSIYTAAYTRSYAARMAKRKRVA